MTIDDVVAITKEAGANGLRIKKLRVNPFDFEVLRCSSEQTKKDMNIFFIQFVFLDGSVIVAPDMKIPIGQPRAEYE